MEFEKTALQMATQEYNLMIADMFECVNEDYINSEAGQALIFYFMIRFKEYVMEHQT